MPGTVCSNLTSPFQGKGYREGIAQKLAFLPRDFSEALEEGELVYVQTET
jgi:hypothetical protein